MTSAQETARRIAKLREKISQRAEDIKHQVDESLALAIDRLIEGYSDHYLELEEQLETISTLLYRMTNDIQTAERVHDLRTFDSRLDFLEDRYDELDSRLRNRPKRRRRRINLADFFTASQGYMVHPTGGEVYSATEAYRILGLEYGVPLKEVTAAFRRKAKELHPDSRNGDRSSEPELRKLLAAYQFLKSYAAER